MVCNNLGLSLVTPIFFYMSRADLGVGLGGPAPAPPPILFNFWFIKYFSFTCSIWNPDIC